MSDYRCSFSTLLCVYVCVRTYVSGMTGILMCAAGLPVCLTRAPKPILHPPPINKSDMKPVPGINGMRRKTKKKHLKRGESEKTGLIRANKLRLNSLHRNPTPCGERIADLLTLSWVSCQVSLCVCISCLSVCCLHFIPSSEINCGRFSRRLCLDYNTLESPVFSANVSKTLLDSWWHKMMVYLAEYSTEL